jgi:hypothetical protein
VKILYSLTQAAVDVGDESRIRGEPDVTVQHANVERRSRTLGDSDTAVKDSLVAAILTDDHQHGPPTIRRSL